MANRAAPQPASPQLRRLRILTKLFDELIPIPGTRLRVGLDAILGLLPGGGDVMGGTVSTYALLLAARLGAPAPVVLRMGLNILIDTLVGAVPLLGDIFDVGWKANRKNLDLLERYLQQPAKVKRASMALAVAIIVVVIAVIVAILVGSFWLLQKLF